MWSARLCNPSDCSCFECRSHVITKYFTSRSDFHTNKSQPRNRIIVFQQGVPSKMCPLRNQKLALNKDLT